jgi:hypothetical protein
LINYYIPGTMLHLGDEYSNKSQAQPSGTLEKLIYSISI